MNETIVTLEVARLAAELGFDWICRFYYVSFEEDKKYESKPPANFNDLKTFFGTISAPTQSLLQKWLRDELDTHIEIDAASDEELTVIKPLTYQWHVTGEITIVNRKFYDNYEEALEDALKETLKLVK